LNLRAGNKYRCLRLLWRRLNASDRGTGKYQEEKVRKTLKLAAFVVAVSPLLLAGGCAGQSEIDSLRGDVSALRTDVNTLKSQGMMSDDSAKQAASEASSAAAEARAAAEAARQAAAAAQAAAEKADRVYRESLAK
jgi:ElaB/YqjD/DUF883 family membrane-anchored ribosome-binding protein